MDKLTDRNVNVLLVVSAVFVLGLIVYLGSAIRSVETLEERLRYKEPSLSLVSAEFEGANDIQMTYVPVYSHIYASGGKPLLLESTLSIRNTSLESQLEILSIDYYNTAGELSNRYIDNPRILPAMATATYLVEKLDSKGGDGANFVVSWRVDSGAPEPLIEAVMVGSEGEKQVSFSATGRRILPLQSAE